MEPWNDSQKRLWRKLDLEVAKLAKDFRSLIMITFIESAALVLMTLEQVAPNDMKR